MTGTPWRAHDSVTQLATSNPEPGGLADESDAVGGGVLTPLPSARTTPSGQTNPKNIPAAVPVERLVEGSPRPGRDSRRGVDLQQTIPGVPVETSVETLLEVRHHRLAGMRPSDRVVRVRFRHRSRVPSSDRSARARGPGARCAPAPNRGDAHDARSHPAPGRRQRPPTPTRHEPSCDRVGVRCPPRWPRPPGRRPAHPQVCGCWPQTRCPRRFLQ